MKMHVITVGKPKLSYAKSGWDEYFGRLQRMHTVRLTQLSDKHACDTPKLMEVCGSAYRIGLVIAGQQYTSPQLASKLDSWQLFGKEISFVVGGPEGLPTDFVARLDERWSLSWLTLPHDLAMVVTLEALYRASTIQNGYPYHK